MEIDKQGIFAKIKNQIQAAGQQELYNSSLEKKLVSLYSISAPELNKNKDEIIIRPGKAVPDNRKFILDFIPIDGHQYEYLMYQVPYKGDENVFRNVVGQALLKGRSNVTQGFFNYVEYSQIEIVGNIVETNRIKEGVTKAIEAVDDLLEQFQNDVHWFNKEDLKNFIIDEIQVERKKRQGGIDTVAQANPFI